MHALALLFRGRLLPVVGYPAATVPVCLWRFSSSNFSQYSTPSPAERVEMKELYKEASESYIAVIDDAHGRIVGMQGMRC